MIAAVARRSGAAILARDTDMNRIAEVFGIDLDEASLIPWPATLLDAAPAVQTTGDASVA